MASTNSTSGYSYLSTAGNRFSGLASGMDIDDIVEKLMKAESAKMEKLQQQKQKYEWQREAYRSVNTKLEAFRTEAFDKYGKQSDFVMNTVVNSNENKVSATATATATGTLNITSATTAKGAQALSRFEDNRTNNMTVAELLDGTSTSGTFTLKSIQQDGSEKLIQVSYDENDTLETLAQKINAENKGVTAMVGNDGRFSLASSATGEFAGGTIQLATDSNGLFEKIGFDGNELANGSDATYTINGVTKTSKTNSLNISGYTIQLKGDFTTSDTPVTISSNLDTTAVVDKVKSFIETYNALIKDLKGQTSEKKNYSYSPLTDAQKAEMSEDEIKKWEEQAKKGIIRGDKSIETALSSMRLAIADTKIDIGDGNTLSIFDLGLDTNKDGTLFIEDETKLRSEIEKNPQNVGNLFTQSASSGNEGIISKVRSAAKKAIDTIHDKAGKADSVANTYSLGKDISSVEDKIKEWKDKLKSIEERYYKQFSAMETAIQKANSQSSIFAQG